MTNSIRVYGELLASESDRVLRYRLLPFGSIGRTNVGAVIASADSVEIPEDISHLTLNTEHNQMTPVGRFVSVEKGEDALYASVSISKFPRGDEALALTASKSLTGISVEIAGAVIQDGKLVGGELIGAALCKTPAFPEAVLMASDTGDIEEALNTLSDAVEGLRTALSTDSEAPVEEPITEETAVPEETLTDSSDEEEDPFKKKAIHAMETNAIPTSLTASGTAEVSTFDTAVALIASAAKRGDKALMNALETEGVTGRGNLFAALANVTEANGDVAHQPTWLGEIWLQKDYQRKFVPLLSTGVLTGMKMEGWKFTQGPLVDSYAGFPAQIPTRAVLTETWTAIAERVAGGNSLDRIYKDLGNPEFLAAYYRAQTEQYAIKTDQIALAHIIANATAVTADTVPAGVSATAAAIVDGALQILDSNLATPTGAIVPTSMYRELLLSRNDDSLQYLSSALGLEGGTLAGFNIVPSNEVTAVHVISKSGAKFFEAGSVPIRVEVDTPANGGFDSAVFGYVAAVTLDDRAIVRVDAPVVP